MNQLRFEDDKKVFVNLLSDAGMKAVYADPQNKKLLIQLLNYVLPENVRVSDIKEYRDREQSPDTVYGKKTILDLVCTDSDGNIFSVEVQRRVDKEFFRRCVYYASHQYHSQLSAGEPYSKLRPVYEIAFLAEDYPHVDESLWDADHIISEYCMKGKRTGEYPPDTIFIIFAEMSRFDKTLEECVTTRDKVFYWFCHSCRLEDVPETIADDPETEALATATRIAAFTPDKKETYDKDVMTEMDIIYEKEIERREGFAEGEAKGRAEGIAEGLQKANEKAISTAKNFLKAGIPVQTIADCIGLSVEEVLALK